MEMLELPAAQVLRANWVLWQVPVEVEGQVLQGQLALSRCLVLLAV